MDRKAAIAGRVDPDVKQKIDLVADEEGVAQSEIVRRAVKRYIETNADKYECLPPTGYVDQMLFDLEP